jgi:hypothetical protein
VLSFAMSDASDDGVLTASPFEDPHNHPMLTVGCVLCSRARSVAVEEVHMRLGWTCLRRTADFTPRVSSIVLLRMRAIFYQHRRC